MKVLGIMSGTSLDGIDLALVDAQGTSVQDFSWRVIGQASVPYAVEQRDRIQDVIRTGNAASICQLNVDLAEWFSDAALEFLAGLGEAGTHVHLIGCHGQTIWHIPPTAGPNGPVRGATLQIGDAATLVERTGIEVVSDFRSKDMAVGGHGAPLVPWTDLLMFARSGAPRCLQNVGGMANVTWLPPRGSEDDPVAFDTGPGMALVDQAVRFMTRGAQPFDRDGQIARTGAVDVALLRRLLADPYLEQKPPKSTGRERYGAEFVLALAKERGLEPGRASGWPDLVATLTEFTAASIAGAYERWIAPRPLGEVVVTGGGARNPVFMARLQALLAPTPFMPAQDVLGFDADVKEAVAFAVLAWAYHWGVASNLVQATGAARPVVLGSLTPASGRSRV